MSGPIEAVPASPEAPAHSPARHRLRRPHYVLIAFLLLILAAFLLPLISLGRYHRTIANSLSRSLGHPVHLSSVNLAIFPLPGLVIHDLVVEEDPAFGAEPLLRAPQVTVYPRLSSLWTQRLEVSRIDLDEASVNLVRDPSGRWNFSSLLLKASRTAAAPTAQRRPSATPRFPYIEFSGARINFKQGAEKKPFSFFNADASVWLADPNRWRIRFEAQPVRTNIDLDLGDTGTIRIDGSLTRSTSLDQLPLDLHAQWTGAQLGQVSRLVLGSDSGWRGDLRAEADITGTMRNLLVHPRLHIINAHRLEFTPLNELDIDALCEANYHHAQQSLDHLICLLPTGDGHLLLTGSVPNLIHPLLPSLNLEINHTPVSFVVSLLGLLRRTLPSDISATGTINGNFTWAPEATTRNPAAKKAATTNIQAAPAVAATKDILTGHAVADNVTFQLTGVDQPIKLAALRFSTPSRNALPQVPILKHGPGGAHSVSMLRRALEAPPANIVLLESTPFAAGQHTPMQVSGQFSRSGFSLHFTGESALSRLQPIAGDFSQLHALDSLQPKGTAQTDLTFSGPWILPVTAEAGARVQGWVRLQHAEAQPAWLPEPIQITAATVQLGDGKITWANAAFSVNGIDAKGSASYPDPCNDPSGCAAEVSLDFPALDAAALQSTILGPGHGEFLQAILSQVESPAPPWPRLIGTIHAETFTLGRLKLNNVRAAVTVHSGSVDLLSLDAGVLGGSAHATGSIQNSSGGPKYALKLSCAGVKLAEAAGIFHEKWGTGSIDGQASLNLNGVSGLAASASGDFSWIVNGIWSGSTLAPLRHAWAASGTIANQTLTLTKGPLLGTIGFDRKLDLSVARPPAGVHPMPTQSTARMTGTVAHPIVATAPSPLPPDTAALRHRIR